MIPATFIGAIQQRYQAILPYLNRYKAAPDGASIAARDLSQAQARDLVIHHYHNQHLVLENWPEFDAKGNPTYPKVGEKVKLKYNIGGVQYVADNPVARGWELTKAIDQRLAVLLVRLGQWLKKEWAASVIHWGGIGTGRNADDRHVQGFALDFHGAVTQHGEFNVWRDWGSGRRARRGLRTGWPWTRSTSRSSCPLRWPCLSSWSSTATSRPKPRTAVLTRARASASAAPSFTPTVRKRPIAPGTRITSIWRSTVENWASGPSTRCRVPLT
jgi:hypothetical protein